MPPSERCKYRLDKSPTGPFNRKKLIAFLEKKAKEEKDWDEVKPFTKEIRGKFTGRRKCVGVNTGMCWKSFFLLVNSRLSEIMSP